MSVPKCIKLDSLKTVYNLWLSCTASEPTLERFFRKMVPLKTETRSWSFKPLWQL